jgi:hypothetical protein
MAFDVLNVGSAPNDGNGESLRSGGQKINANFAKAVEGPGTVTADRLVVFNGTTGYLVKQGSLTEATIVQQTGADGAALLPVGDDSERPTPSTGMLRFNTDSGGFEGYDGVAWGAIGGVAAFDDAQNILATQVFG